MKRVNMTTLARSAKNVVADAVENPTLIITPGDKEDMILISEGYFKSLKDSINKLAILADGMRNGKTMEDCANEHLKEKLDGDSHKQKDLLK